MLFRSGSNLAPVPTPVVSTPLSTIPVVAAPHPPAPPPPRAPSPVSSHSSEEDVKLLLDPTQQEHPHTPPPHTPSPPHTPQQPHNTPTSPPSRQRATRTAHIPPEPLSPQAPEMPGVLRFDKRLPDLGRKVPVVTWS